MKMNTLLRNIFVVCIFFLFSNTATLFGAVKSENKIKIACVGNSITENVALAEAERYPSILQTLLGADYEVRNYGLSGRTLLKKGSMPYWNEEKYQEVLEWAPDIVIIKLGTNDCHSTNSPYLNEFESDYIEFVNSFKNQNSNAKVFACFPLPYFHDDSSRDGLIISKVIPAIEAAAQALNIKTIDLHTPFENLRMSTYDDTHPNANGTNIMANIICKAICESCVVDDNPPAVLLHEIFGNVKPYLNLAGEEFPSQTSGSGYLQREASDLKLKSISLTARFANCYLNKTSGYVEIPDEPRSSKGLIQLQNKGYFETPFFQNITKLTIVTNPSTVNSQLKIQIKGIEDSEWVDLYTLEVTSPKRTVLKNLTISPSALRIMLPSDAAGYVNMYDFILEGHLLDKQPEVVDPGLQPATINTNPLPRYSFENIDFYMSEAVERTPNGRIWNIWISGGDNDLAYLAGNWSDDNGKTWTEPKIVIDPHDSSLEHKRRTAVAVPWTAPNGDLWIFYDQSMTMFDGRDGCWYTVCKNPDSETPIWSDPVRISNGGAINKPIVHSSGAWMLPAQLWNRWKMQEPFKSSGAYSELDEERGAFVMVSTDNGTTWEKRGKVLLDNSIWEFDEQSLIELSEGRLWMTLRSKDGIYESFSNDLGFTWTTPQKYLNHTSSRHFITRLHSGKLLLVKHGNIDETTDSRINLMAFLSDDEGVTWKGGLLLDERKVSYPNGFQAPDGMIYVNYDRRGVEILLAAFTEEDILSGEFASTDSFKKRTIAPFNLEGTISLLDEGFSSGMVYKRVDDNEDFPKKTWDCQAGYFDREVENKTFRSNLNKCRWDATAAAITVEGIGSGKGRMQIGVDGSIELAKFKRVSKIYMILSGGFDGDIITKAKIQYRGEGDTEWINFATSGDITANNPIIWEVKNIPAKPVVVRLIQDPLITDNALAVYKLIVEGVLYDDTSTGIIKNHTDKTIFREEYFDTMGRRINTPTGYRGILIKKSVFSDRSVFTEKILQ